MDKMTELQQNPTVRKIVSKLPLPIKLPTLVRRNAETDALRPLLGRRVLLTLAGAESAPIVRSLSDLGAGFILVGPESHVHGAADIARSAGRPTALASGTDAAAVTQALQASDPVDALILEVNAFGGPKQLFQLLQPNLQKLAKHCRVLLVSRLSKKPSVEEEANAEAVIGFVKSFAREVGTRAITANAIEIHHGCKPEAIASALSFFASDRARYVTSQRVKLTATESEVGGLSLQGEHAVVTGGARGIGAAIAQILARQGAAITIVDLPNARDAGSEVAAKIVKGGGKAHFLPADVTNAAEISEMLKHASALLGEATVLVNNAGITRDKTFAKMAVEKWNQVIEVNYEAAVKTTEAFLALRGASQRPASVVYLSSVVGIAGNFGQTNYTLSKAAVIGHVRALARELKNKGVRVNAIAPGFIDTVLTREVPLLNREMGKQLITLLQAGEPEDIAEIVAFFASRAAAAVSGETLRVDGGMFIGA